MLVAHLVPGYFSAVWSRQYWNSEWSETQRVGLWLAALGSTVAPDVDVMFNVVFRGFFGHSTLWTHSIFVHGAIGLCWYALHIAGRWPYIQTLVGLVAIGGLSHLLLDVIAHSTPLFYPLSLYMAGVASAHVLERGLWGYLTDPVVLLEPLLLGLVYARWVCVHGEMTIQRKITLMAGLLGGVAFAALCFLFLLPTLQGMT
jgi:hypothetical protein